MMDALAEAIRMDPLNYASRTSRASARQEKANRLIRLPAKGLPRTRGKGFRWAEARKATSEVPKKALVRRGVGVASCVWFVGGGGPPSTVILRLFSDGSVNLNMGASDIGTGTKTVMALVVAEELGVKPDIIQIEHADTGTTQYATQSGGSKTVPTESPAVRAAAIEVKQQLLKLAGEEMKLDPSALTIEGGVVVSANDPSKKLKIAEIQG